MRASRHGEDPPGAGRCGCSSRSRSRRGRPGRGGDRRSRPWRGAIPGARWVPARELARHAEVPRATVAATWSSGCGGAMRGARPRRAVRDAARRPRRFPRRRRARVLWAGIDDRSGAARGARARGRRRRSRRRVRARAPAVPPAPDGGAARSAARRSRRVRRRRRSRPVRSRSTGSCCSGATSGAAPRRAYELLAAAYPLERMRRGACVRTSVRVACADRSTPIEPNDRGVSYVGPAR